MAVDLSKISAVLKIVYGPKLQELINDKNMALELFTKSDKNWEGKQYQDALHVGRNTGVMAIGENEKIPSAGEQAYADRIVPMRYIVGRIQLSAQSMILTKSNQGSFIRTLSRETDRMVKDIARQRNRMLFGAGQGVLAKVKGAHGAVTKVEVDGPGGFGTDAHGNRYIRKGMFIAFVDSDGTDITVGAAIDAAVDDNDFVVLCSRSDTSALTGTNYKKEPMGLMGLIDDGTNVGTLHNVSRTTYPIYKSYVTTGVGTISADLIQRSLDVCDQQGNGTITKLFTHYSVRRAILAVDRERRRYVTDQSLMNPDMGTRLAKMKDITFGDIPISVDRDCPYGTIFGIDPSTFEHFVAFPGAWIDEDGNVLNRLSDTDAFEGRYRLYENFGVEEPNTCFRMDGVTATRVVLNPE